jgi:hypothetical protein
MNDHSATASATPEHQPELVRRLEALAQTTTCDVDTAWDTIQDRVATGRPRNPHRQFPPRLLLAAAIVAVLLAAAAVVATHRDDGDGGEGDRVQTADHSADEDPPSRRRPRRVPHPTAPTGREAPVQPGAAGGQGSGRSSRPSGGTVAATAPTGSSGGAPAPGGGSGPGSGTTVPTGPIPPSGPAIGPDTPLSRHGIGPITAGMTLREAEQVAEVTINVHDDGTCTHAWITWAGVGLNFLAEDMGGPSADPMDSVIRSMYTTNGRTEEGVALRDPVSKLDEVYGPPTHTYPEWTGPGSELRIYASGGYGYAAVVDNVSITWLESGDANWTGIGGPNRCTWP